MQITSEKNSQTYAHMYISRIDERKKIITKNELNKIANEKFSWNIWIDVSHITVVDYV